MTKTALNSIYLGVVILAASACGDAGEGPFEPQLVGGTGSIEGGEQTVDPTEPEGPDGPEFKDVPEVPRPETPGGDVPPKSEIVTKIVPYTGAFNPAIDDAWGHWVSLQTSRHPFFPEDDKVLTDEHTWSEDIRSTQPFIGSLVQKHLSRLLLQNQDGEAVDIYREDQAYMGSLQEIETSFEGPPIEEPVYLRRDRHWELTTLESGGTFLLLDGEATGELSSSYTKGVSTTETQEFGRSVTATAGLGIGPLNASISGTLSESFSSSTTVSESTSETFTKTVSGKDDAYVQFMVWELVETYSFSDENGDTWEDDAYVIAPAMLVRRGAGVVLQVTEFEK
jgi:hypothetical protein